MSKRDFYEILNVSKTATDAEIKKAFKRAAMKLHPDRNQDNPEEAEEKFKETKEAYDILSDAQKRAAYDQFGHAGVDGSAGGFGGGGAGAGNFSDVFGDVFGDIFGGSAFESFFGGGRRTSGTGRRGSNLRIKLNLTLDEIANGAEKKIKVKRLLIADGVSYKSNSTI